MRWAYLRGLDEFVGLLVGAASTASAAAARHVGGHVVRGGGHPAADAGAAPPPAQVEVHDVGRRPPLPMVAAVPHLTRIAAERGQGSSLCRPGGRQRVKKQSLFTTEGLTTTITKRHGDLRRERELAVRKSRPSSSFSSSLLIALFLLPQRLLHEEAIPHRGERLLLLLLLPLSFLIGPVLFAAATAAAVVVDVVVFRSAALSPVRFHFVLRLSFANACG